MKIKSSPKTACLLIFCFLLLVGCETNKVDVRYAGWENVTLVATGLGSIQKEWSISARLQAVQTAKINAYAQLESQANSLNTDTGKKVSAFVEKDKALAQKIAAFVRGAKITQTENVAAGVEIMMELFLGDNFKATLGLSQKRERSPSNPQNGDDSSPH
ncbi:hypothetical protein MNBD_NITROSPIRAE01-1215 [hydrothermal vent metagenome]|uniref:Lipoprotein n=1 Tax=hydrothermal vent metagenome TaxID=652676 RepID=A0A3B1CUC1_9ZZZZ